MASRALTNIITKFKVVSFTPRTFQKSLRGEVTVSHAVNKASEAGHEMKDKASSTAQDITQKAKDEAGKVSGAAQNFTEKAKETAEGAWNSVKDTSQKIKGVASGKAEESKEFVKENADAVKKNMNTKNYN